MMELVNRNEEYYQYLYKNRAEVYRKQTEAYLETNKKNILVNELAKLEVYMSPDLIRAFLSDEIGADGLLEGLASGQFSIDGRAIGGPLNLDVDQQLSNDIIALVNTYRLTSELEVKAEEFQDQQKEEAQIDVEEKLVDAGGRKRVGKRMETATRNISLSPQNKSRSNGREALTRPQCPKRQKCPKRPKRSKRRRDPKRNFLDLNRKV